MTILIVLNYRRNFPKLVYTLKSEGVIQHYKFSRYRFSEPVHCETPIHFYVIYKYKLLSGYPFVVKLTATDKQKYLFFLGSQCIGGNLV